MTTVRTDKKRVFILGAGFSKPAGMPLATELLPLLSKRLKHDEMQGWLDSMRQRLAWLDYKFDIEQVFHCAHFDIEAHRLKQHLASVGREDESGTPWDTAESISAWLSFLGDALLDVILEKDDNANLSPIKRWAKSIRSCDSVLTFNYDTLVEHAMSDINKVWNHGTGKEDDDGIPVFKLHGSIDWIVSHRSEPSSKLDLLFDKENTNRPNQNTGHVEDDYVLWRCRTRKQLQDWISGRSLQLISKDASPRTVGITGLGAYKQLHHIPGLGLVWARGMRALYKADAAIVVGFSMSDFDAMAQMQFAEVARARQDEDRPLHVTVIDPFANEKIKSRFERVFRGVKYIEKHHEEIDWSSL